MLFVRCLVDINAVDLILAAIVVLYAIQVILDSSHISARWDEEAQTRFSHEDLSRELEEARDDALIKRAEAEAANASKTAFLANISHELRTPLNAILGFSELIARECLGPVGSPRYKEYASDIHNSGTHLLSLINDLLDVAKIEAGRMEVEPQMVETERTLESALKFVGAKARERGQTLTIAVDQSAAFLYADERALKQIVINLASNAVKFTQDGGRIEVSANAQCPRRFRTRRRGQRPGHFAGEDRPRVQAVFTGGQSLRSPVRRNRARPGAGSRSLRAARRPRLDRIRTWQGNARHRRVARQDGPGRRQAAHAGVAHSESCKKQKGAECSAPFPCLTSDLRR